MKRIMFIFAFVMVMLFAGSCIAEDGVNEKLAICAKMEDGEKRLECYDSIAIKKEDRKSEKVKNENLDGWIFRESVNKMDDSKIQILSKKSKDIVYTGIKNVKPMLVIRCEKNQTEAFVIWDTYITDSDSTMTVRIDKEKAKKISGDPSSDSRAVFISNPIKFIKSLYGHNNIFVQITPFHGSPIIAEFDIAGIEEAIEPICKECGWK